MLFNSYDNYRRYLDIGSSDNIGIEFLTGNDRDRFQGSVVSGFMGINEPQLRS